MWTSKIYIFSLTISLVLSALFITGSALSQGKLDELPPMYSSPDVLIAPDPPAAEKLPPTPPAEDETPTAQESRLPLTHIILKYKDLDLYAAFEKLYFEVEEEVDPFKAPDSIPLDPLYPTSTPTLYPASTALLSAALDRLSQAASAALGRDLEISLYRPMSGEALVLALSEPLAEAEMQVVIDQLQALPEVAYAEPDAYRSITLTPVAVTSVDDTYYSQQWNLGSPTAGNYGINAPAAWDITRGSTRVIVAVIDTGITNHFDLQGRTVAGYDFITNATLANDGDGRDSDPSDPGDWVSANSCGTGSPSRNSSWHGTHVAGTIGASSNNGSGVAGINWNGLILPVRVLGRCGGVMSDIADGMRWAAGLDVPGVPANPNRAQVLNLSLGGPGPCSETESNAISAITAAGSTVVVAAGNSSSEAISFTPASCPGVITVAATDRNGSKAYYSNYGSVVEISAPGGDFSSYDSNGILSTLNSGLQSPATDKYAFYQGTSMAAPHVAGVTSLLYSLIPALTPTQAVQILQNTVTSFPLGSSCTTALCGRGIVNAGSAVGSLPRLTSLSPRSANPGSSLTLTVNGANFSSSARMVVNGVMRTTTFVNSSQLSAQLTPSDLVSKGAYSVTVSDTHPTYGSLTTDKLYLLVGLNRSTYLPLVRAKFQDQGGIHLGVIANGNFEAGSSGWTIYSNSGSTIIRSSFPAPVTPRSGSYAAWLGGRDYEASYLQQIVRVDPAAPFLIYYHWIESTDLCNYDYEYVRVDGFLVTQFTLCSFTKTNGWVRQSLDFSAYANKTIILHIDLINDDSYISSLYLDDFAFSATP